MLSGSDANRSRIPYICDLGFEVAIAVKDLNSLVCRVRHIDIALRIHGDSVNRVELARAVSSRSPGLNELSILIKLGGSRIAKTVGNIDVPGGIPRDVGGALENIALCAGSRNRALRRWVFAATSGRGSCAGASLRASRTVQRHSRNPLRLSLPSEQHLHLSIGIELDHHARHLVHDPYVVLRINAYLLRND